MQTLWAQPHVAFKGRWHTIDDAGINPRRASATSRSGSAATRTRRWSASRHRRRLDPLPIPPDDARWRRSPSCAAWSRRQGAIPPKMGIEVWTCRCRRRDRLARGFAFWNRPA